LPGGKHKQPYFIQRADGEPLAFAGLWEVWRGADRQGEALRSCTIVTTTPNETLAPIHDRMPVILPPTRWEEWLDPTNEDVNTLGKLLVPAPASLLTAHPVSTLVNNVRHDGPELMAEAEPDELVG
jgi:putative SOS response-associated peptidase YedK